MSTKPNNVLGKIVKELIGFLKYLCGVEERATPKGKLSGGKGIR